MKLFTDRQPDLVMTALAIVPLAIENQPGPSRSTQDHADMNALRDEVIESEVELPHYALAAQIAVTDKAD